MCGFVNSGGAGNIWPVTLDCGAQGAGTIDGVVFANYGQPTGFCNGLSASASCSKDVSAVVAAACVGKASCTLLSSDATFGAAPCANSRLAVEVTCSNKAVKTFTYWAFEYPDQGMLDFLTAADSSVRTSIPNFSTIPQWLWTSSDRSYYPDDPLGEVWDYEQGRELVDPTGTAVGDYYGRLVAHYVEGGFVDEAGRFIPGYNLTFSHWEVLNELEHGLSPQLYTVLYDAIVAGILRWCPNGAKNMKFMGLALGGIDMSYITYFLNKTNHASPDIPIDAISFHHYAGSARDGGANGSSYEGFFPSGDGFVDAIKQVQAARAASDFPNVLMDADEVGVILDDDNDPQWTSLQPGFPALCVYHTGKNPPTPISTPTNPSPSPGVNRNPRALTPCSRTQTGIAPRPCSLTSTARRRRSASTSWARASSSATLRSPSRAALPTTALGRRRRSTPPCRSSRGAAPLAIRATAPHAIGC